MLSLGLNQGQACREPSRRAFLRVGTVGALGLTPGDLLALPAAARDPSPSARAVITLWLWGGPSHLDTFYIIRWIRTIQSVAPPAPRHVSHLDAQRPRGHLRLEP